MALPHRRPYGMYRWLANASRWFYRLGLGWVLGHQVIDPKATDAAVRSQIETFFRGVRFRPTIEPSEACDRGEDEGCSNRITLYGQVSLQGTHDAHL